MPLYPIASGRLPASSCARRATPPRGPRSLVLVVVASLVVLACGVGGVGRTWRTPDMATCEALADPGRRSACRERVVAALGDDMEAVRSALDDCEDPGTRDLLRLTLLVTDPSLSGELCSSMEGDQARRWCDDVQGRMHLWRTGTDPTATHRTVAGTDR